MYTNRFNPSGSLLASGSFDKMICTLASRACPVSSSYVLIYASSCPDGAVLWKVYGDCKNVAVLKGHKSAVLEVCWSWDATYVLTLAAERNAIITAITLLHQHRQPTCCVCTYSNIYSAGADCLGAVWDVETAQRVKTLRDHKK